MKTKFMQSGLTVTLLLAAGQVSNCRGRVQYHGHKHGDILGRIMHNSTASSGSSFTVEATDSEY